MGTYRHNADFLAGIAQLVEHLTCNQGVPSSTLGAGTISADGVAKHFSKPV